MPQGLGCHHKGLFCLRCKMLNFAAKSSSAAGDVAVEDSSKKAMRAEVLVFVFRCTQGVRSLRGLLEARLQQAMWLWRRMLGHLLLRPKNSRWAA